ncbi:hypothetical protein [Subtercola boreus]|nr:hypothetical protein [Subtercola boreus]
MNRFARTVVAAAVGLLVLAIVVLAIIQRLHLYSGLARIWG